ncbi:hypothetical protein AFLA_013975 [Aspergillus flavus NRRL3357]|nr:hypothetical protein AFLA_013975 [Aspergillus flavus NRRL3357]
MIAGEISGQVCVAWYRYEGNSWVAFAVNSLWGGLCILTRYIVDSPPSQPEDLHRDRNMARERDDSQDSGDRRHSGSVEARSNGPILIGGGEQIIY